MVSPRARPVASVVAPRIPRAGARHHHAPHDLPTGRSQGKGAFDLDLGHSHEDVTRDGDHGGEDHDGQDHAGEEEADPELGAAERSVAAGDVGQGGLDDGPHPRRDDQQAPQAVDDARHRSQELDRGPQCHPEPLGDPEGERQGAAESDGDGDHHGDAPWSRGCPRGRPAPRSGRGPGPISCSSRRRGRNGRMPVSPG